MQYCVKGYIPQTAVNAIRAKIYQANDLHKTHNNNDMSTALRDFFMAGLAELEYKGDQPVAVAPVSAPAPTLAAKKEKAGKKKEKPAQVDEGEMLFDTREEAIEALDMPASKDDANKLKAKDIIKVVYGVGNEDPILFLNLPSKATAESMQKKDLLSIIYGV